MKKVEPGNIELLLSDYFRGDLPPEKTALVDQWISSGEENRRIAEKICSIEQALAGIEVLNTTDTAEVLKSVHGRINRTKKRHFWSNVQRIAAILCVPAFLAGAFCAKGYLTKDSDDTAFVEMTTEPGMTSHVVLPDGSNVWLNSNSSLRYPSRFKKGDRRVELDGEGYFQIQKQDGRKFLVCTDAVQVEVTGTEFDVEAYSGKDGEVRTSLVSGKVNLGYTDPSGLNHSVSMEPGDTYTYDPSTDILRKENRNLIVETSWKDGKIVLDNTSLADALKMIEKRFNVEFLIRNEKLLENRYTGTFTQQSRDVILDYFKRTTDIHFDYSLKGVDQDSVTGRQRIIVY